MLLEFALTNYRSIRDRQEMSFRADMSVGKNDLPDNLITPIEKSHGGKLVKTAIVYGANAAGKSNFLKGLYALEFIVTKSDDFKLDKPISTYEPFKLDKISREKPIIFEIEFVAKNNIRYRYEVSFSKNRIEREELFIFPNARTTVRKTLLFSRKEDLTLDFGDFYKGKRDFTINPNQLVLSHAGVAHPSIVEAYRFFSTYLFYAPAQSLVFDEVMLKQAEKYLTSDNLTFKKAITSLIAAADTGISDIFIQKFGDEKFKFPDDIPDDEKQKIIDRFRNRIKTVHPIYEKGEIVDEVIFDLSEESTGTIKMLGMASFIVDALHDGSTIIVDELDKSLHPLLSRMLIEIFQNPSMNPHNAQLIFSTHDVSLIDRELFRRDQIYLIDKNNEGASVITRLSEFKGISKVIPLQKWYMSGMFKAVPAINPSEITLNFAEENG
jgi:uncharacterized protein